MNLYPLETRSFISTAWDLCNGVWTMRFYPVGKSSETARGSYGSSILYRLEVQVLALEPAKSIGMLLIYNATKAAVTFKRSSISTSILLPIQSSVGKLGSNSDAVHSSQYGIL